MVTRRRLAALASAAVMATTVRARADFISAPDVVVYCDTALAAPLRGLGADFRARTGVPVRVFASPGLMLLGLLARGTRSDVLVTLRDVMDAADRSGLLKPHSRSGSWRNPVVLAGRDAVAGAETIDAAGLHRLLGDGRLAVVDPVAADRMDGPAIVERLGWSQSAAGRIDGMPSGQEVAFGVASGADRLGLLYRSDLAGHRNVQAVGMPSEAAAPPAEYEAAIGRNVLSRHAAGFLTYLTGGEATGRLRNMGLEAAP